MIPDELEALVLADSIGALDPYERVELQVRLDALTSEQRMEVARLYETASAVAQSTPLLEPSPYVRDRVLAEARKPATYTVRTTDSGGWIDTEHPGIRARILAVDKERSLVTMLIRAEPGAAYPSHKHHGPEECYVIRGSVIVDGSVLHAGDFIHADPGTEHGEFSTTEGAEVLLVGAIEDYLPSAAS